MLRFKDVHLSTAGNPLTAQHYLGKMDVACSHCDALHFMQERVYGKNSSDSNPRFSACCSSGQVSLPPLQDPPEPLLGLLTSQSDRAKRFRRLLRPYNCAFQLASSTLTNESDLEGMRNVMMQGRMSPSAPSRPPAAGGGRTARLWPVVDLRL